MIPVIPVYPGTADRFLCWFVDGYYDWVKEHIYEGAPINEADHCGDPPLILAAGNGKQPVAPQ